MDAIFERFSKYVKDGWEGEQQVRVPSFYCPKCERFKKWFQVERVVFAYDNSEIYYCRHCGSRLIETEEFFLKIVKQVYERQDRKDNHDGD